MSFYVYLSGEIHTDWRDEVQRGAEAKGLDVVFTSAVTDHDASDAAGDHLGAEESAFWRDHKSAKVNAIRTKTLIEQSDLVVVRFGDKYKQWNAAFDAGYCAALGKPYVRTNGSGTFTAFLNVNRFTTLHRSRGSASARFRNAPLSIHRIAMCVSGRY